MRSLLPIVRRTFVTSLSMAPASHLLPSQSAVPYAPPVWCPLTPPESGRLRLAHLPSPLYRVDTSQRETLPELQDRVFYIKRDDCTGGVELGGNKIRKLEFLLAQALQTKCTDVVTIGGLQSNHCRATAAACRMVGLEPHLILRTRNADQDDVGMVGNVLLDRLVASKVYTCTPGEYGRVGSKALVERLCQHLEQDRKVKTFAIPVGGSNALGTWGYLNAVEELLQQWYATNDIDSTVPSLDHVVFACGSGGTAAGIVLGMALAHEHYNNSRNQNGSSPRPMPRLHAIGVCDGPDYFYRTVADIVQNMGFDITSMASARFCSGSTEDYIRAHLTVHQGKGRSYAQSTAEELEFVAQFGRTTGVALDPVYSGKALYHFAKDGMSKCADETILFWHTGGALGLYDKVDELTSTSLLPSSPCRRLDVYGNGKGDVDVSGK